MIACPECNAKNSNRMVYCGFCRGRLKPISPRLREDILFIIRQECDQRKRRFVKRSVIAIGLLGILGYSKIVDFFNNVQISTQAIVKSGIENAVSEASKTALPQFQSAMQQVQQKREPEVVKAIQQSKDEIRSATLLAKQQIKDATQKTITQISTTTTGTSPSGRPIQSSWSITDPFSAGILKGNSDVLKTLNVNDPLRLVGDLKISKITTDLTTGLLSSASDMGCLHAISGLSTGIEIGSSLQRSNCPNTFPVIVPSYLTPFGSSITEPIPTLPTLNTKY